MYVRVNGHLKAFQGIRQIVAFSVRYGYIESLFLSAMCMSGGSQLDLMSNALLLFIILGQMAFTNAYD